MERLFGMFIKKNHIMAEKGSLEYWQQLYFVASSLFLLVGGLPMIVIGTITFIVNGMPLFAIFDIAVYLLVCMLLTNKRINLDMRETIMVASVYFVGVYLLVVTGGNGAGIVFVMTAFISGGFMLKGDDLKMYAAFNIIIFLIITVLLEAGVLDSFLISTYGIAWYVNAIAVQSTGIVLSWLIHHTVDGIEEQSQMMIANENNMNATMNAMTDGVIVTTREGLVSRVNPHIESYYGVDKKEARGKHINDIFEVFDTKTDKPMIDLFYYLKKNMEGQLGVKIQGPNKSHYVVCKLSAIRDEFDIVKGYVCLLRDMTDMQQEEVNLRHAQKMEAIGTMAGGVAHDFNNMLGGILGYAELSREFIEDKNSRLYSYIQEIINTSVKASELTKQLLAYARRKEMKREPVDINKCVYNISRLMERTMTKKIEISTNLGKQPLHVYGDESLLENAILNLGLNAKDAMPQGGRLTITVGRIYLDESYCSASQFDIQAGTYVHILVKDQGEGMTEEVLNRIFEPFFTTKEMGKGTGLGMAATYGTVLSHRGAITVKSIKGVGTNVDIYLPLYTPGELTEEPVSIFDSGRTAHGGKLLVIDDEDVIRTMVKEILEMLGYEVLTAKDGFEGIEVFEANKDDLRGVLLDMIMPKMNGREVYSMIKAIQPEAKVIMISGFIDETHIDELYDLGMNGFVKKPFTIESIIEALSVL